MTQWANGRPTTNMTHREYFVLATHRYPKRGIGLPDWHVLETSSEHEYAKGLILSAYVSDASKNVVINVDYLGSPSIEKPLFDDIVQIAATFSSRIKSIAMRKTYKLSHTGYSYGGVIAAECALIDRFPAVIFESPEMPFKKNLPSHITDSNIATFLSDPKANPQNYYGQVYYVELHPDTDKKLLDRWNDAYREYAEHL